MANIFNEMSARRYMPSSLSSAAGRNAITLMGAPSAAAGTHVWKGIAPALASAPTRSRM